MLNSSHIISTSLDRSFQNVPNFMNASHMSTSVDMSSSSYPKVSNFMAHPKKSKSLPMNASREDTAATMDNDDYEEHQKQQQQHSLHTSVSPHRHRHRHRPLHDSQSPHFHPNSNSRTNEDLEETVDEIDDDRMEESHSMNHSIDSVQRRSGHYKSNDNTADLNGKMLVDKVSQVHLCFYTGNNNNILYSKRSSPLIFIHV